MISWLKILSEKKEREEGGIWPIHKIKFLRVSILSGER